VSAERRREPLPALRVVGVAAGLVVALQAGCK
jgi:hypothetical protein